MKKVKGIKINLDFIFNNFPVRRIDLRLVILYFGVLFIYALEVVKPLSSFESSHTHLD